MGYICKILAAVALLVCISQVNSCGGRRPPPRCTYRQCQAHYDGHYSPNPGPGQCVTQRRRCHHRWVTHTRNGGCPGTQHCHQRDIVRTWCNCVIHTYHADKWTDWVEVRKEGECNIMERKADSISGTTHSQRGSCPNNAANIKKEHKKLCPCKHFGETQFGEWVENAGESEKVCRKFTRTMQYEQTHVTMEETCPHHDHGPHNPKKEETTKCLECNQFKYVLKGWSDWNNIGDADVNGCVEQKRHMRQDVQNIKVEKVNGQCPDANIQTPEVESRIAGDGCPFVSS